MTKGVAGIAMALRGPRERMKNGGAPGFANCMAGLPVPSPSGFRPSPE